MVVRHLPLVAGMVGGGLLLLNRVAFSPELLTSQSRSDALGVLLSALLVLTGLLWQRVQPNPPQQVELEGEQGFEINDADLSESLLLELGWATRSLLLATPAQSLVLLYDGAIVLRRGLVANTPYPPGTVVEPGTTVARVLKNQRSIYLVDLKLYPARVEFDYLPANAQALIVQPLGERGVLMLAADAPRSFTDVDKTWIEAIAQKLTRTLETTLEQPESVG